MTKSGVIFKTRPEVKRFIEDNYDGKVQALLMLGKKSEVMSQEERWLIFTDRKIIHYCDCWSGDWTPQHSDMDQKDRIDWQIDTRDFQQLTVSVEEDRISFDIAGGEGYTADYDPERHTTDGLISEITMHLQRIAGEDIPQVGARCKPTGRYVTVDQDIHVDPIYNECPEEEKIWSFDTREFRNMLTQIDMRIEGLAQMAETQESISSINVMRDLIKRSDKLLKEVNFTETDDISQSVRNIVNLRKIIMLLGNFSTELDIILSQAGEIRLKERLSRVHGTMEQLEENFIQRIQEHDKEYMGEDADRLKCMQCFEEIEEDWDTCPSCGAPL